MPGNWREQLWRRPTPPPDPGDRARVNNLLGILRRNDDPELALEYLTTARELAVESEDPGLLAGVLNNLALAYLADGEAEKGIEAAEQALDVYRRIGDRHREAAVHNNLADMLHKTGTRRGGDGPPQAGSGDLRRGRHRAGCLRAGSVETRRAIEPLWRHSTRSRPQK